MGGLTHTELIGLHINLENYSALYCDMIVPM